jgi:hypothetical protein
VIQIGFLHVPINVPEVPRVFCRGEVAIFSSLGPGWPHPSENEGRTMSLFDVSGRLCRVKDWPNNIQSMSFERPPQYLAYENILHSSQK